MEKSTKEIVKGTFWMYLGTTGVLLVGLIATIVLARLLDKELWGIFSSCIAITSLFSVLCDLGLGYTIQYYTASLSTEKRFDELKKYLAKLFKYKTILILIIGILIFIFSDQLAALFHVSEGAVYFRMTAAFFIFFNLFSTFNQVLAGLKLFKESNILSFSYSFLRLVLAALLVILGFGVNGAVVGYTCAIVIVVAVQIYLLRKLLSFGKETETSLASLFSFGIFIGVAQVSWAITMWTDSVMIGLFIGATFVGFYKIALTVSTATAGLISVFNRVLFPIFTGVEARREDPTKDLNRLIRYGSFFAIPAVVGLALASDGLVNVFFGSQYIISASALWILAYICFDAFITGIFISLFFAKKEVKVVGKVAAFCAGLNVVLNAILIPILSIVGAAIASVITRVGNMLFLIFESKRKWQLKVDFSAMLRPLAGSVVMGAFLLLIKSVVNPVELLPLIVFILLGTIVYVLFEALIGFNIFVFGRKAFKMLRE